MSVLKGYLHAHLVSQHAALPGTFLLLLHPVKTLLLEREQGELKRRVSLHRDGLDGGDVRFEVTPDIDNLRVVLESQPRS